MGIVSIVTDTAGQVGNNARRVLIITTDNLATITTAGYLNAIAKQGYAILPTDKFDIWYGYVSFSSPGTFGEFTPTISNGSITLNAWVNPANVLLPVIADNVASFNSTTGQIKDSGFASANIQNKTNIKAATTANIGGSAGPTAVAVVGLTAASIVVATVESASTPVSVVGCTAGVDSFNITFSANPGATCTVNYVAFIAPQ